MILSAASSKPTSCEKSSSGPTSILDRAVEELPAARGLPRSSSPAPRPRAALRPRRRSARSPRRVEQPFAARRARSSVIARRARRAAQRPQPDPRRLPARLSTYARARPRSRSASQARIALSRSRSSSACSSRAPLAPGGAPRAGRRPARAARLGAAPLELRAALGERRSPLTQPGCLGRAARRQRLVHPPAGSQRATFEPPVAMGQT